MSSHPKRFVVPGSHATPKRDGHRSTHRMSTCEHCGKTIARQGFTFEWFHYQTDEIDCEA